MRLITVVLVLLCGCASPIEGVYELSASKTAGSCPDNRVAPREIVIDASHTMRFIGVPGGCQLEEVDGAWVSKCDLLGGAVSTIWHLHFTDAGFWGESSAAYFSSQGLICYGEYAETGTRKR